MWGVFSWVPGGDTVKYTQAKVLEALEDKGGYGS